MQKFNSILKKSILTVSFGLFSLFSFNALSSNNTMNFLPMEDALSAYRNTINDSFVNPRPYRDFYSLDNKSTKSTPLANVDFLAFILLGSVYFFIVNRNSKPRNISL